MFEKGFSMSDMSDRGTPPESDEEWRKVWSGVRKAHAGWPYVSKLVAVGENWKVLFVGFGIGIAVGGEDLLRYMGVIQ